ncbi:MAG TPA: phage holin family protein [Patescibacteria group bacterium]|nr:phage holin family protein [Patescibacteria group bacterium]
MKTLLRNLAIYTLSLFFILHLVEGASLSGGFWTLLSAGIVLTLFFILLKPILSIITLPVNIVTLGVFNIFVNALLLYLLTIFVTEFSIVAFISSSTDIFGFVIPSITFNTFFAYVYTAFILTALNAFIRWLIE